MESRGVFRVNEDLFPVLEVVLADGGVQVVVELSGPLAAESGDMVMVFDPDGALVVRGRWQGGPLVMRAADTGFLRYTLHVVGQITDGARRSLGRS